MRRNVSQEEDRSRLFRRVDKNMIKNHLSQWDNDEAAVFPVLLSHTDPVGETFVSVETVAKKAGISYPRASRALNKLIRRPELGIHRETEERSGKFTGYRYWLRVPPEGLPANIRLHHALIDEGHWATMSDQAKRLYLAMRAVAYQVQNEDTKAFVRATEGPDGGLATYKISFAWVKATRAELSRKAGVSKDPRQMHKYLQELRFLGLIEYGDCKCPGKLDGLHINCKPQGNRFQVFIFPVYSPAAIERWVADTREELPENLASKVGSRTKEVGQQRNLVGGCNTKESLKESLIESSTLYIAECGSTAIQEGDKEDHSGKPEPSTSGLTATVEEGLGIREDVWERCSQCEEMEVRDGVAYCTWKEMRSLLKVEMISACIKDLF